MPVELFGALILIPLPARLAKLDLSQLLAAHAGAPAGKSAAGRALGRWRFPGGIQGLTAVVATVVVVGTGAAVWRVHAASQKPGTQHLAVANAVASPRAASTTAGSSQPGGAGLAPLFAVLETRNCPAGQPCEFLGFGGRHDTVAVAKANGFAIARATFSARTIPGLLNAVPLADLEGQVADGAVYFVDGSGTVLRMTPDGGVTTAAKFPIDSARQSISFAVSPDGKEVMAAVLTYPHFIPGPSGLEGSTSTGPWRLQIEKAIADGTTVMLHQWQTATDQSPNRSGGFANIWLAGWNERGPIALVGQEIGVQNAWLNNQRYFAGHIAQLNADGTPGASIGPTDCLPYWRPINGRFVCTRFNGDGTTQINLVDLNVGNVLWSGTAPPSDQSSPGPGDFVLSPDGTQLAMDGQIVTLATNAIQRLAPNFEPQGWLDATTLIGLVPVSGGPAAHVGILRLDDPLHPEDWGFSGAYVGLVS